MKRVCLSALFASAVAIAAVWPSFVSVEAAPSATPTFNKDVLPVLQKQCQECHRPNSIAPMSFLTYKDTRPYARAIEKAVVSRTMPPWFADPTVGHFKNTKLLSDAEIELLSNWAKNGAPEGDPNDKPAPVHFAEGWTIGKPDIVVEFPKEIQLPATGVIDQSNLVVRAHFEKDMWVKAAEVKPGNARVVHHMKAIIRPPHSTWLANVPEGELYVPQRGEGADRSVPQPSASGPLPVQDILAKYNPGVAGQTFTVGNAAKFIAAGSDIVFEIHYTTTGKPETDRSMVGIVLADGPPPIRHLTVTGTNNGNIDIAPGDPELRSARRGDAGVRCQARLGAAASALSRPVLRDARDLSERRHENRPARPELPVRLAGGLRARRAARFAEGHAPRDRRPLRQLRREQVQPRSHGAREVRAAEQRRDARGIHGRAGRCESGSDQDLRPPRPRRARRRSSSLRVSPQRRRRR